MDRAYSLLNVKELAEGDDFVTVRGMASTPTTDRMGDVVEPMGAKFKLPMPLLWQHDAHKPIGHVTFAKPSKDGIPFEATIPRVKEAGTLKDRIDEAIQSLKHRLVAATSIGFRPVEGQVESIKGGGYRFKEWEWMELSLVTIPANAEATISSVKSLDTQQRAAHGQTLRPEKTTSPPGATGTQTKPADGRFFLDPSKGNKVNTTESMAAFEAKRVAAVAQLEEIVKAANEEGATLDAEQKTKAGELQAEIKQIDEHLSFLRETQKILAGSAKEVPAKAGTDEVSGMKVRSGEGVLRANVNLPKGIGLARYVKALAYAKGDNTAAQNYAKQWDDSTPEVTMALKAAVAAGTTADSAWAGPLVYNANLASEFVDYLRPQTILGKLDGLRRVPFNVRYPTQTGGSTVAWVGEGAGKPVSKLQFSSGSLGFAKAAGIVVITMELARFSSPSAELLVRNDLAEQMRYFLDAQFIDPGVAAVANVNPASVLNSASNKQQSAALWTTVANVHSDVFPFLNTFATNEISLEGAYWVMTPEVALKLSLIYTAGGENRGFPDITINGGTFMGFPVIVSNAVPHSTSAGSIVALIKPSEIFLADEGGVAIDVSQEASLLMDSAPTTQTSATPTGSSVVSMFQTNSIAIRCERIINWSRRRTYGVGYIDNVHTS